MKRQIYEYLTLDEINKIENIELQAFYTKIRSSNHKVNSSRAQPELKGLLVTQFSILPLYEQVLMTQEFGSINSDYDIERGLTVKVKGACL